jgi:hypothetical protein
VSDHCDLSRPVMSNRKYTPWGRSVSAPVSPAFRQIWAYEGYQHEYINFTKS